MVAFSGILDISSRRSLGDRRQINRWKGFESRLRKLVKIIKDANSRFDDYSFSPKIRQLLKLFSLTFFVHIKMIYYWFNRQELLQKAKDKFHNGEEKEIALQYFQAKKNVIKKQKINIKVYLRKRNKQKSVIKK